MTRTVRVVAMAIIGGAIASVARADAGADAAGLVRHADEPGGAIGLIDRAAARLGELEVAGIDAAVMFGVPTQEEKHRAAAHARAALDDLARAEAAIAREVEALEAKIVGGESASAEEIERADRMLGRLVDFEQAQRLPLLRGAAHALIAGADDAARSEASRAAIQYLAGLRVNAPAGESLRRLSLSAALLQGAGDETSRRAARSEIEAVVRDQAAAASGVSRLAAMAAIAAGVEAPGEGGALPAELQGQARARARLARARAEPERRVEHIAAACGALLRAVSRDDAAGRVAVYARVSEIVDPTVAIEDLPAEALFARAVTVARERADSAEARALLRRVIVRDDVTGELRRDVLWEAAALDAGATDVSTMRLVAGWLEEFVGDCGARGERERQAAAALEAVLRRLVRQATAEATTLSVLSPLSPLERRWMRSVECVIAQADAASAETAMLRAELVLLRARAIEPATLTREQVDALFAPVREGDAEARLRAVAASRRLLAAAIADGRWSGRAAGERAALLDGLPAAVMSDNVPLVLARAEALVDARSPEAAEILRPLLETPADAMGAPSRPRIRLLLAEAESQRSRFDAVVAVLRPLVDPVDAAAGTSARPEYYWRAWAAILAALRAGGTVTDEDLLTQIRRLEIIDPEFGGAEAARVIKAVRGSIRP